jgi:hypothetical protein
MLWSLTLLKSSKSSWLHRRSSIRMRSSPGSHATPAVPHWKSSEHVLTCLRRRRNSWKLKVSMEHHNMAGLPLTCTALPGLRTEWTLSGRCRVRCRECQVGQRAAPGAQGQTQRGGLFCDERPKEDRPGFFFNSAGSSPKENVSIFKRHQTRKGDEGAEKEVVELLVSLEVMGFTGNHSKRLNTAQARS